MSDRYKLQCEYIHCFGIKTLDMGIAESKTEAVQWQKEHTGTRPSLPSDDPIKSCPVVRCPLKKQLPRYVFRGIE